jgi:hypothetical protein
MNLITKIRASITRAIHPWVDIQEPHESMFITPVDIQLEDQRRQDMQRALDRWRSIYNSDEAIAAWSYGSISDPIEPPAVGALGIHGRDLLFVPAYHTPIALTIPLHMIRWISHQNMSPRVRDFGPSPEALTLHCTDGKQWWVYTCSSPHAEKLAHLVQIQTQANYKPTYPIAGPIHCHGKQQDTYGQWQDLGTSILYLAPDRLLSTWQSWIELRQIQHLALLPNNTLKITYLADKLYLDC